MVEVLPALTAQCHLEGVHLVCHLGPDGGDNISFLPGIDISSRLSHPVSQVLPFRAGNPKLEGTVRNEDPEGVPSKGRDMFLGHPPTSESVFEPP